MATSSWVVLRPGAAAAWRTRFVHMAEFSWIRLRLLLKLSDWNRNWHSTWLAVCMQVSTRSRLAGRERATTATCCSARQQLPAYFAVVDCDQPHNLSTHPQHKNNGVPTQLQISTQDNPESADGHMIFGVTPFAKIMMESTLLRYSKS